MGGTLPPQQRPTGAARSSRSHGSQRLAPGTLVLDPGVDEVRPWWCPARQGALGAGPSTAQAASPVGTGVFGRARAARRRGALSASSTVVSDGAAGGVS